jgi:alpha-glucosidase (family GH31 glycosyl hydrolase)
LEDIPVFARAGAIIPLAPKVGWGGIDNPTELDLFIFPGADNEFLLYEDDGETTDYQRGKFAITRFTTEKGQFMIHPAEGDLNVIPAGRTYRIHLRGLDEKTGDSLSGHYDAATRTLSLAPVSLKAGQEYQVKFEL